MEPLTAAHLEECKRKLTEIIAVHTRERVGVASLVTFSIAFLSHQMVKLLVD